MYSRFFVKTTVFFFTFGLAWITGQCPEYSVERQNSTEVSPEDDLQAVLGSVSPGTVVRLRNGVYSIRSNLQVTVNSVTIRSKSGNRDSVILDGNPGGGSLDRMNFTPEVVAITASDVHLVDLTVRYGRDHGIHIYPPANSPVSGCMLHNLHVYDCGQQLIKVNSNGNESSLFWVDSGIVEGCLIEFVDNSVMQDMGEYFYTGGIDVHGGLGWVIRWNHFRNIQRDGRLMEHAVHFWSRSRGTVVENNRFENVYRGIGFGMKQSADGLVREYEDGAGEDPYFDHLGGIIRNNTICNRFGIHLESGIEIWSAFGTRVFHNTVFSADDPFSSIEYRWVESIEILNNLVSQQIVERDGVKESNIGYNLPAAGADFFVDVQNGDLHLADGDLSAVDGAIPLEDAGVDIDGEVREGFPDIGADEYNGAGVIPAIVRRRANRIGRASSGYCCSLLGRREKTLEKPSAAGIRIRVSGKQGNKEVFSPLRP